MTAEPSASLDDFTTHKNDSMDWIDHPDFLQSGGTNTGVRAVEEEPNNEQNCHSTGCSHQPEG